MKRKYFKCRNESQSAGARILVAVEVLKVYWLYKEVNINVLSALLPHLTYKSSAKSLS